MKKALFVTAALLVVSCAAEAMATGAGGFSCSPFGAGPYHRDDKRCGGTVDYSAAGKSGKEVHSGGDNAETRKARNPYLRGDRSFRRDGLR